MSKRTSKDVLRQYHHIAVDALKPSRPSSALSALLEAAEAGNCDQVQKILEYGRGIIDMKCSDTGDTALIAAARNGSHNVIRLLLQRSADCTLQNDNGDTALEVASPKTRKFIIDSIQHEGTLRSNAQGLLQSAWLGDAVSVRKSLSGRGIDVNCRNSDGMTPLLLVTKDLKLFDKVQHAMQTEYNPVEVVEELIKKQANVNASDAKGRSALHLIASTGSVHARKMVSLLLQNGSHIDSSDDNYYSPLHTASQKGHTAIVVALVEEGADVNIKAGENGDTPLMLSAREGHTEAAKFLLSRGADVTAVDKRGESALSLATVPGMVHILKEAWTEQSKRKNSDSTDSRANSISCDDEDIDGDQAVPGEEEYPSEVVSPLDDASGKQFFITNRQISAESLMPTNTKDLEDEEEPDMPEGSNDFMPQSEVEADDELEYDAPGNHRIKPATRRAMIRQNLEGKRHSIPVASSTRRTSWHEETAEYSSADENTSTTDLLSTSGRLQHLRNKDERTKNQQQRLLKDRKRPSHVTALVKQSYQTLSRSCESLNSSPRTTLRSPPSSHTPLPLMSPTSPELHDASKKLVNLPTVPGSNTNTSGKAHGRTKPVRARSSDQLPALPSLVNNLQPVALVSVDADKEKLHVQRFGGQNSKSSNQAPPHRQFSNKSRARSNSTGASSLRPLMRRSVGQSPYQQQPAQQHVYLPSVVSPMFTPSPPTRHQQQRQRPSKLSSLISPHHHLNTQHHQPIKQQLSIVKESSSPRVTSPHKDTAAPVSPLNPDTGASTNSTLKASLSIPSSDQFEVDSLERSMRRPAVQSPPQHNPGLVSPQDNVMVNYAVRDGSAPLSPIWNQLQYLRCESSSSGEYITSFIGRRTPFPRHLLSPDEGPGSKKQGIDSGHDEASASSSEEEDPMEEREELKWKKGRLLGKGAFGKVWEGLMDSAKLIAVKEVDLDVETEERAEAQFSKLQLEVDILRSLCHRNIVKYWGADIHMATVYIFMEFIAGGSLQSILKRFGSLDERTISHYTRQIVQGVDYLHDNGIIHRDIKGANIMVTQKGVIKLIDFGCAKRYVQEHSIAFHSVRGTPYWMAPEVIRGQGYGRKSDIWSIGCTVHEMATAKPPWGELPPEAAMFQIGIGQSTPALPDQFSESIKSFFLICMLRDPAKRLSAHELLDQPFLNIPAEKPRRRT